MIASGYDYAGAQRGAAPGAQGGIVKRPQQEEDDLLRYLVEMGAIDADEQAQQQGLARAQALRGSGSGLMQGRQMGEVYQAPTAAAGIVNALGQGLGGYQEGMAGNALQGMPGRRQGVKLPRY